MSEAEAAYWEERYRNRGDRVVQPAEFVVSTTPTLGPIGSALDLAGGTGRNAIWLARQEWRTTLVDVSPAALEIARADALAAGVALGTQALDLDAGDPVGGPWDLVVIHHYLNRPLLRRVWQLLRPGGHLVVAHQTIENATRHNRPGPDYLLDLGELPALVAPLAIVSWFEGWTKEGRHEARLVGRRVADA